jgi:hypothetical protein
MFAPDLTMPNSCLPRRHRQQAYFHLAPYEAPQSLLAKLDPASTKRTITLIRPSQSANKASFIASCGRGRRR